MIPCFPQFSDLGPLDAQHGFARNERWDIVAQTSDSVTMRLASTPESLARWPHAFEATYAVALEADGGLATTLEVKSPRRADALTTALHTYFRVGSVVEPKSPGSRGVKYLDQLDGSKSGLTDKDGLVGWEREDGGSGGGDVRARGGPRVPRRAQPRGGHRPAREGRRRTARHGELTGRGGVEPLDRQE